MNVVALPRERAKKERLRNDLWEKKRRRLRQNLWEFCVYMDGDFFTPGKHHLKLICAVFQYVALGLITRVFLSMPPRAGKSYTTSMFCAWLIGRDMEGAIMRNSYSGPLAHKFSYDIRQIVTSPEYRRVFPGVRLRPDKKALEEWGLVGVKTSSYFCAGVGGALTGKGCDKVAILDDPIKNMEVALSEVQLDNIWNWYQSVHKTRMEKDCPEIHIATRWSKNDPIGKLKQRHGSVSFDQFLSDPEAHRRSWVEMLIPALDTEMKSFCEDIKTTEQYNEIRDDNDDFVWSALYMQEPVDVKGIVFPSDELLYFEDEEIARYEDSESEEGWDAVIGYTDTADKGGDWLASVTGKLKGNFLFITDVIYTLDRIEITEPRVAQMIIDTTTDVHTIEANAGGRSFAKTIRELLRARGNRCTIRDIPNQINKDTRIIMKGGQVRKYFKFRRNRVRGSDYDRFFNHLTNYVILSEKQDDAADATVGLAEAAFGRAKLKPLQSL